MDHKVNFKKSMKCNVLIFDSGLGGLSIYKKIKHRFPNVNYVYACDNNEFPYGEKKELFIIKRCFKIISIISNNVNITAVILACNTASITSLLTLQNHFPFPIIGIIPDIEKSVKVTKNKIIGLLATKTTIHHCNIQNKILSFYPNITIKTLHNPELVVMAEKKLKYNFLEIKNIKNILKPWLISPQIPDTIILGCTHFYFLKHEIKSLFLKKTKVIDSNIVIPKKLCKILKNSIITNKNIAFFSKDIKNNIRLLRLFNKYNFTKFKKLNL
ncbi:MAG: glutamate racemase [Buchnera aphidicola (Kaburagia rhusicola rhusicola)]